MKKLAVVALALASMGLAGCVVESGTMLADWTIVAPQGATCDQVNATHVEILTTRMGSTIGLADITRCAGQNSGTAETSELDLGDYTVQVSLINAGADINSDLDDIVIDTFPPETAQLLEDGQVAMLGQYNFEAAAPATYKVQFRVDYGTVGANCDSTMMMGAAVVQQETLLMGGAQCLPLSISFGGNSNQCGTTGTAACTTCGSPALCQEKTVTQVIDGLMPGNYTLEINGLKGITDPPATCYESTVVPFTVGSTDVDLGTIAAPFNGMSGPCSLKPEGRR